MDDKAKMELLEIAKMLTNEVSFKDIKDIEVEIEDWDDEINSKRVNIRFEYRQKETKS